MMAYHGCSSLRVELSDEEDNDNSLNSNGQKSAVPRPHNANSVAQGTRSAKDAANPRWTFLPSQPKSSHLARHLKPISSVSEAFEDLTIRAIRNGLLPVLTSLAGRTIRVATMCSGTESPIVALELIRDCLKDLDLELNFEHAFSSEIVQWKQTWIQRNFKPKVLFRDITEMTEGKAMTVLGELAEIPPPGQIHILIAGFACVDFSMLNNNRKDLVIDLDQKPPEQLLDMIGGESSVTLSAILKYARHYRPPILLLENILGASWPQITKLLYSINYSVGMARLDTKHFYLPQTRQRGYLLAISNDKVPGIGGMANSLAEEAVLQWSHTLDKFIRPASSPVDSFMLKDDSQDLARDLRNQTRELGMSSETDFARDWSICWGRYQRFREHHSLGGRAPYTQWHSGNVRPPEHAQALWLQRQPNRIKDTLDCLYLLSALQRTRDYDISYKSRFPDASQNIDRSLDMAKFGLVGCITPNNIIYHTVKGRVPTGLELLRLQGLDSDRLLVSKESHQQLKDLAGNAMSTTVVGAGLLAALIVGFNAIDSSTWGQAERVPKSSWIGDRFVFDPRSELVIADNLDFGPSNSILSTAQFCELASLTTRKCYCEGSWNRTAAPILQCRECKHTCCVECGGNPVHDYGALNTKTRHLPSTFIKIAMDFLPTGLVLQNFEESGRLILDVINDLIVGEKLSILSKQAEKQIAMSVKKLSTKTKKPAIKREKVAKGKRYPRLKRSTTQPGSDASRMAARQSHEFSHALHPENLILLHGELAEETSAIDVSSSPSSNAQRSLPRALPNTSDGLDDSFANALIDFSFKKEELTMLSVDRAHQWVILYESKNLRLKLTLKDDAAEWSLYLKAPSNLPAESLVRSILSQPIATMHPDINQRPSLCLGRWNAHVYSRREYPVKILALGKKVPSWKAELGLQGYENEVVCDKIGIFPATRHYIAEDKEILKQIAGSYQLLPSCGTAKRSLHRRIQSSTLPEKPVYLFLESLPNQSSELDNFLLAQCHERVRDGESRRYYGRMSMLPETVKTNCQPKTAEMQSVLSLLIRCCSSQDQLIIWRYLTQIPRNTISSESYHEPWSALPQGRTEVPWRPANHSHTATFVIDYRTERCSGSLEFLNDQKYCSITPSIPEIISNPLAFQDNTQINQHDPAEANECKRSDGMLLKCNIPWHGRNPNGRWTYEPCLITELNQHYMQLDIQWLVHRLTLVPQLRLWNPVATLAHRKRCGICTPILRPYSQRQIPSGGLMPMEDPETVTEFLKVWKKKPVPITIATRRVRGTSNRQELCVTVNVQCLIHRLLASLPEMLTGQCLKTEISWRICTGVMIDYGERPLGILRVHDCSQGIPYVYRFGQTGFTLREDQARVFQWVLAREAFNTEPFMETIMEESVSRHLQWSVEAQAIRTVRVRGGLCADHVGFGKTVILLATIKAQMQQARKEAWRAAEDGPRGQIPIRATLVLVPKSLAYQWSDEILKFWRECNFLLIVSMEDLYRYSVSDFQKVDIVIAAVDLFVQAKDAGYTSRIAEIAGVADPARFVLLRQYIEWYDSVNKKVAAFVEDLRNEELTASDCLGNLRERSYEYRFTTAEYLDPSKRSRGKRFVAAQKDRILGTSNYLTTWTGSQKCPRLPGEVRGFPIESRSMTEIVVANDRANKRRKVHRSYKKSGHLLKDFIRINSKAKTLEKPATPPSSSFSSSPDLSESLRPLPKPRKRYASGGIGSAREPSKLEKLVNKDDKDFLGPVFSMFRFHRKIIDEISYLSRYQEETIKSIPSNISWLLSGTARLRDAMDVKRIAALIGIHIGLDDDSYGRTVENNRKAVNNARSDTEKIEASRMLHTIAWHKRRLIVAQAFLDRFARMNQVELPLTSRIQLKEIIYPLRLPALHSALYHECRTLLTSEGFKDNLSFSGHGRHDRSMRLHFVLHNTRTAEEALIKATFYVPRAEGYSLMQHTCHELPDLNYEQVLDARADDIIRLTRAVIRRVNAYLLWLEGKRFRCVDRKDANYILDLLRRSIWLLDTRLFKGTLDTDVVDHLRHLHSKHPLPAVEKPVMTNREARRRLERLGKLIDAMTSAVRSFRYLRNAQQIQKIAWSQDQTFLIDDIGHVTTLENARLSGLCGHIVCKSCIQNLERPMCPVPGCSAGTGANIYVYGHDLAESSPDRTSSSIKIQTVVDIINALKKDEQALIFSQWHAMNEILTYCLERSGITTTYIRSGEQSTAQKVAAFKNLPFGHQNWSKVMILNPSSNTAAGHNIQNANAVIFLSPLSASSIDDYKSAYVQCIGRAARYGQRSIVKVYHLLASRTIEVNIHESRRMTTLYVENDQAVEISSEKYAHDQRRLAVEDYTPRIPD